MKKYGKYSVLPDERNSTIALVGEAEAAANRKDFATIYSIMTEFIDRHKPFEGKLSLDQTGFVLWICLY